MPGVSGPESLSVVKETYPGVRIAIVSGSEERKDVLKAVATGLSGYVPKSLPDDDIVGALEDILDGRIYVPRFMTVATGALDASAGSGFDRPEAKTSIRKADLSEAT